MKTLHELERIAEQLVEYVGTDEIKRIGNHYLLGIKVQNLVEELNFREESWCIVQAEILKGKR